jgi:hypothetical protein
MRTRYILILVIGITLLEGTFHTSVLAGNSMPGRVLSLNKILPNEFKGQVLFVSNTDDTLLFCNSSALPATVYLSVFNSKTVKWSRPQAVEFAGEIHCGKELFLSLKNKKGKSDLYSFFFYKGQCSSPQLLNSSVNSRYNERSACISSDGNTLYFSSDRKGGNGGYDIYFSEKTENGEWGLAHNLGTPVNTKSDEDFPFLLKDDVTLYFSSESHGSAGGFDIFNSTMNDEGAWSQPESIGSSINSKDDEICFYLTADEKLLFYSSPEIHLPKKDLNIFEFINYQQEYTQSEEE